MALHGNAAEADGPHPVSGVDTQRFRRRRPSRLTPGTETATQLIAVGRFVPENDLHIALEAVAKVRAGFRDELVLSIVGDGPLLSALRQQARGLEIDDALIWHGEVPYGDLVRLYSASELMLMPRQSGAPPRVVAEAMACGLPVVGFRAARGRLCRAWRNGTARATG